MEETMKVKNAVPDKNYLLKSFAWCTLAYAAALAGAWFFVRTMEPSADILLATLIADTIATIIIFIFSMAFKNASFYDPYWSVAPIVIAVYWNAKSSQSYSLLNVLFLVAFTVWGIRLTLNWARGWKGLHHEEWRYIQLKKQTGNMYPLVNFTGIHLFPTLLVFFGMVPAYFAMMRQVNDGIHWLSFAGLLLCMAATLIEFIADEQQRSFKRNRDDEKDFCKRGLWKFSRHPNYFGEVSFWWGIYLIALPAMPPVWTIGGAVSMTLLFVFISIPMMEKHMIEKRAGYTSYQKEVWPLVPWFRKKRD